MSISNRGVSCGRVCGPVRAATCFMLRLMMRLTGLELAILSSCFARALLAIPVWQPLVEIAVVAGDYLTVTFLNHAESALN